MRLTRRVRNDERGSALITALAVTTILLALGLALLAIVDTQTTASATERTRDRGFNLAESVLNSEAFVLGRNWPASAPVPAPADPRCSAIGNGFQDTLGSTVNMGPATARLRKTINASYTDAAYSGATWQVNLCDDTLGSAVWNAGVLNNVTYDANANKQMWVVAQSALGGKKRSLVGLVTVRENQVIPSKYGLVAGGLTDDIGGTINTLATGTINGVLGNLLGTSPAVAADPTAPSPASGVTGVRCGATDVVLLPLSTCLAGTIGGLSTLPVVTNVLTGGQLVKYPTVTTGTQANIDQLKTQAISSSSYYPSVAGATTPAAAPLCAITTPSPPTSIVYIGSVGTTGVPGTVNGPGDQWCYINASTAVQYKALVVGSGRVIIRGNGTVTNISTPANASTDLTKIVLNGVVYALNQQRLPVADGGQGLGDSASPGREVVRIENGAHVKGGVYADGRGAKVGIYPPLSISKTALCNTLPLLQRASCLLLGTVGDLVTVLGLG
ncbi:MAG: hypothetical protein ABIM89_10745, partial [Mycobacteriales bacterium]